MSHHTDERPIITGVVGSDCHMVGNTLVANAFEEAGFKVVRLGAIVPPQDFVDVAIETNAAAIVVSSIYGQAEIDCDGFRDRCVEAGIPDVVLYLGGNLSIGTEDWVGTEQRYLQMGFNRVYPAQVGLDKAVADLKQDLGLSDVAMKGEIAGHSFNIAIDRGKGLAMGEVHNERLDEDAFLTERREVLATWPTGQEVDLQEALSFLKSLPSAKVFAHKLEAAKQRGDILIMPMMGKATVEEMLEETLFVEDAGSDINFLIADAYTRKLQFEKAEVAIKESVRQGKSLLNGYPWVNHGVRKNRELISKLRNPVHCNLGNDEDPRLFAEIAYASGATAGISHDLRDLITHAKDYPLGQRIHNNQYGARLAAWYTEHGVPMDLNAVACVSLFTPPSMGIAIGVLESLLNAKQGVKRMSPQWDTYGSLVQNVAGIRAMARTHRKYLDLFGHHDMVVSPVMYPGQFEWPKDRDRQAALCAIFCTIGVLGGVDWMYIKSLDEALATPSKESNAASVKIHRQLIDILKGQRYPETPELLEEQAMIEKEASLIVDRVLELGDGDSVKGTIRAVELGVLDAPFSPYVYLKSNVKIVHDVHMGRRWLDFGSLPFSEDVKAYHRQKIAERERRDGRVADLKMVVDDMRAYARDLIPA